MKNHFYFWNPSDEQPEEETTETNGQEYVL